jgi:hypothetical protein
MGLHVIFEYTTIAVIIKPKISMQCATPGKNKMKKYQEGEKLLLSKIH